MVLIEHKNFGHFLEEDVMPDQTLLEQSRALGEPLMDLWIGTRAVIDIWTKPLREKLRHMLQVFTKDSSKRLW